MRTTIQSSEDARFPLGFDTFRKDLIGVLKELIEILKESYQILKETYQILKESYQIHGSMAPLSTFTRAPN